MGRMPWGTYLWPGLPQIWREGAWSALAVAVGFAALVNVALAASLIWTELLSPGVRNSLWMLILAIWAGSGAFAYWRDRRGGSTEGTGPAENEDISAFREALDHYLKRNWFQAERLLRDLLRKNPRDLDAGLMLATLLRSTDRLEEAEKELDRLGRFETCRKWELEIRREREFLREARTQGCCEPDAKADAAPIDQPDAPADAA